MFFSRNFYILLMNYQPIIADILTEIFIRSTVIVSENKRYSKYCNYVAYRT